MQILTVREVFALSFLEKETTVLHGAEQTPEGATFDFELVASLGEKKRTRMARAASN